MKIKNKSKYITTPARIFATVLVLLFAVLISQGIIIATADILRRPKPRAITAKPKEELSEEEKRLNRIKDSSKEFLPDGTIHLVHRLKRPSGMGSEMVQIYDTNDNLLWERNRDENQRPYRYLSWPKSRRGYRGDFTDRRMRQMQMITPVFSRSLEIPVRSQKKTVQTWRYNPGKDYFTGYDAGGEKIGYSGSTGFTDSKSKTSPFGTFKLFTAWCPQDSFSPILLWQTARRIYQINFEKQQVQLIFESTEANIRTLLLHAWWAFKPGTTESGPIEHIVAKNYRPMLHCITEDGKHHLIMRNPAQKLTVTVPKDWKNWMGRSCQFTATKQDIFLRHNGSDFRVPEGLSSSSKAWQKWFREYRSKPHKRWVELYKVDNQSNLDLLNRFDWTVPAHSGPVVEIKDFEAIAKRYMRKFSPPLYDLAWHLLRIKSWLHTHQRTDFDYGFARMMADIRPGDSVLNWLLSAAMMVFAFWHGWARRTSWVKFVFWLALVGIFNLAGLLAYLALNHTAVIKCPACSKRRGLAQIDCVRCGAGLPWPEQRKVDLIFKA